MEHDTQNLIKSCALWMRIFAMLTIALQGLGLFYFFRNGQSLLLALIVLMLGGLATFLFYVGQFQEEYGQEGEEKKFKLSVDKEIQFWQFATVASVVVIFATYLLANMWLQNE